MTVFNFAASLGCPTFYGKPLPRLNSVVGLKLHLITLSEMAILRIYKVGTHMYTKIQKWGNSQGLRLAKSVLEDACLGIGDEVDVAVRDGVIVVVPLRKIRGRYRIEDLVAQIPEDYHASETDWGKAVGKEEW